MLKMNKSNRLWRRTLRAVTWGGSLLCLFSGTAAAQVPTFTDFEGFTPNVSVDGQGGWKATNPGWDEEVVDDGFGNMAWRVSNAVISGSFGDQPFAPASDLYAGESGSEHVFDNAGPVTNHFFASFDFWSVTGAPQPGLDVTISPDDGAGARQSFLSIEDNGTGIDIDFFDTSNNHAVTNANGGFDLTVVSTGLSYATHHNVAFDITFVDGNVIDGGSNVFGNDIVKIFVDGVLVHTGTTWESYWWTTTEGQTPPSSRAIDTLLFRLSTSGASAGVLGNGYFFDNVFISTDCPEDFQGFETDLDGWEVFSSPSFFATRVPSGTDGVTSATGAWHATGSAMDGVQPAGNWGGYGGHCDCASSSCGGTEFPQHGYTTVIDIYLDMAGGWATDTRFDFSSAINKPDGFHRRDFIFNAGFYEAADPAAPGSGTDRFIVSASNNSGQPPFNPPALPVAITATGWYTFEHRFYAAAGNVLAVDLTITDTSGAVMGSWTRSDPSDIVGSTVGGNRYAWFATNEFDDIAFDNAGRFTGGTAELVLSAGDCQDDAFPGEAGYQIEVELEMLNLTSLVSGFQSFVEYPMGTLTYRGDLSSYTGSPFPLHISLIGQADDGLLELDGTEAAGGGVGTTADALLATLVFDVTVPTCVATLPASFEVGGSFASELSFGGSALATTLTDASAITLDDTPPVLTPCPADITQSADAGSCVGAVVTWTDPTATDDCDPSPTVVCSPPSGSTFGIGTTMVTCTATDACGNESSCDFDVTITATNDVDIVVELPGSQAASRCIHFQMDDCGAIADVSLSFTGSVPAVATVTIQVPCGVWTEICAKDEQHTQWDTSTLTLVGAKYVADTTLVLDGGDTDNDGDIDINDVTLLLAQFGDLAAAGGCPWDGVTKDADFSNNGAVAAEDYNIMVASWLSMSGCACTLPLVVGDRGETRQWVRVHDDITLAADLTGDGRVDVRDVELFELQQRLSGELSKRMRASQR
ncbi:MAG: hypothetical protein DRQ55_04340 [Planctomycetota bacterium]|nr:MAG: hypothetical protein DRQ55_04340 [Planctomycetota bacterium]